MMSKTKRRETKLRKMPSSNAALHITCICMTASAWSSVVFAWASKTKGYLHRVTTPSWPWGHRGTKRWFTQTPHKQMWQSQLWTRRRRQTHRRVHLLLNPCDVFIPDVYQVVQLMDVEFIVLNDVSRSVAHLWQPGNDTQKFLHMNLAADEKKKKSPPTAPTSYRVQDLQESEGHVQETVENSLLSWRNSHLVHLK